MARFWPAAITEQLNTTAQAKAHMATARNFMAFPSILNFQFHKPSGTETAEAVSDSVVGSQLSNLPAGIAGAKRRDGYAGVTLGLALDFLAGT